jgi:hypothetical protein
VTWIIGRIKESPMKWLLALLGIVLVAAAGAGFVASLDLLTTQIGLLYAVSAAIAAGAGLIVLSLAALTHRVDALRKTILRQGDVARREATHGVAPPIAVAVETSTQADEAAEAKEEVAAPAIIAEPPPIAAEAAPMVETPSASTTLVGRYSAGGANYSIFSDGSIEAETDQGAFRFASMNEFKAFVAAKRA